MGYGGRGESSWIIHESGLGVVFSCSFLLLMGSLDFREGEGSVDLCFSHHLADSLFCCRMGDGGGRRSLV